MEKYVDGFVIVVPKNKFADYRKMARQGKKLWLKYGALDYKECVGDDLKPKGMGGQHPLSFLKMTRAKPGETVWFSFIVFRSKKHRDQVNARVIKDPLMNNPSQKELPFDFKRMAYGGFRAVIDV